MIIELHKTGTYDYYEKVEVDFDEISKCTSMYDVYKIADKKSDCSLIKMGYFRKGDGKLFIDNNCNTEIDSQDSEWERLKEIVKTNAREREFDKTHQYYLNFED